MTLNKMFPIIPMLLVVSIGGCKKEANTEGLPVVTLTDPLNNDINVARNKVVALTFSEAMDPLTINATTFTLKQGTKAIAGIVDYSGTTATFTPTTFLEAGIPYTASISNGVKNVVGYALGASAVWSFTTSGNTTSLAVVNLGAAANYVILAKTAINNIPASVITGEMGISPAATSYITGFALTNATGYATSTQVAGQIFAADMASPTGLNLTTAVENMLTAYIDAAGQATVGTTSHFEGIILSMTGITFQTGASLNGRALAQTAVVLDNNAITKP